MEAGADTEGFIPTVGTAEWSFFKKKNPLDDQTPYLFYILHYYTTFSHTPGFGEP